MTIQDEQVAQQTLLTTFDDDFRFAVLHVAWDRDRSNVRTLLFAYVELLPLEVPPPVDDYDPKGHHCSRRLGNASEHCVYVRHAVVPARQALDWYLAARGGDVTLPDDHRTLPPAGEPGTKRLVIQNLGEEPQWPGVTTMSDASDALPFCPQWIKCPRTHHLLPLLPMDLSKLWSEAEMIEAHSWLGAQLHFDLDAYDEYWGSVHLVAPNPVYRRLTTRLQHRGDGVESVLIRIWPRAGKSANGLEISFRETDPLGTTASTQFLAAQPIVRVNFDRAVNMTKVEVTDPRRGLLELSDNPHAFIRAFQVDIALQHKVVVQSGSSSYEVLRSGAPQRSTVVGAPASSQSARAQIISAHYERRKRATGRQHDQRWFKGRPAEARAFLREILHGARRDVLLVDAYFGAAELVEFALSVGRDDVPVRMLTSAAPLRQRVETGQPDNGAAFRDVLRQVKEKVRVSDFRVRVMSGGDRPVIHDRFLVVDDRVWSIGCSFNEFGSRGTMMLALPDPAPIRDELDAVWEKEAETLDDWIARRTATHGVGEKP